MTFWGVEIEENYQIDSLDKQILGYLTKNARVAYTDIAQKLKVANGTVHLRINKMFEAGLIKKSSFILDYKALGYDVVAMLGVHLNSAKDHVGIVKELEAFPEVLEVYYTTGQFTLLVKIMVKNISDLHSFLVNKLQALEAVQSTETYISLDQPISRVRDLTDH